MRSLIILLLAFACGSAIAFAAWRFANKVVVETFMHQEANPDKSPKGPLKPVWIFAKEDRFKAWRATVKESLIVEPRDF